MGRGIVIFELGSSDILYYDFDGAYQNFLVDQALRRGLVSPPKKDLEWYGPTNGEWMDALMTIFSMLVTSQNGMKDNFKIRYQSLTLEDGTKSVYHAFDKYFFVNTRTYDKRENDADAANDADDDGANIDSVDVDDDDDDDADDADDDETVLRKMRYELTILQKIVHFLHGPAFGNIKPAVIDQRVDEWKRIQGIFKAWWKLYGNESCFLTTAVEQLNLNEFSMEKIDMVLKQSVGELEAMGDRRVTHALLISGAKVISHFVSPLGRHYEGVGVDTASPGGRVGMKLSLQPHDLLIILATIHNYFGGSNVEAFFRGELVKLVATKNSTAEIKRRKSAVEATRYVGKDEDLFYDTDTDVTEEDGISTAEQAFLGPGDGGESSCYEGETDFEGESFERFGREGQIPSKITLDIPRRESWQSGGSSRDEGDAIIGLGNSLDFTSQTIYLTFAGQHFHPHKLHLVPVHQGIVLVTLSALGSHRNFYAFNKSLILFRRLLDTSVRNYQPPSVVELEACIRELFIVLRQTKLLFRSMSQLWSEIKESGQLQLFLEQASSHSRRDSLGSSSGNGSGKHSLRFAAGAAAARHSSSSSSPASFDAFPRLETLLIKFMDKIMNCMLRYKDMRYQDLPSEEEYANKLYAMQECHLIPALNDFKDFLQIKSWQNTTGSHYVDLYPGLVHFVYVNRITNYVVAPSFDLGAQLKDKDASKGGRIKDVVWSRYAWTRIQLERGFTSASLVDDHFRYSFFVISGHVTKVFDSSSSSSSSSSSYSTAQTTTKTPTLLSPSLSLALAVTTMNITLDPIRREDVLTQPQNYFHGLLKSTLLPSVTVSSSTNSLSPSEVVCAELFCIHVKDLPQDLILQQCSRLLEELRGSSS